MHSLYCHCSNESSTKSASTFNSRHFSRKKTHGLIHTSSWSHVSVAPKINPKTLPLTNQPRTCIRPSQPRHGPLQGITTPRKRPISILRRLEFNSQFRRSRHRTRYDISIEKRGWREQFNELAVDDGKLSGCGIGVEDRGTGQVDGFCLEIFVEVGVGDGADPVIACLESCSWTSATAGRDRTAGSCYCSKCCWRASLRCCRHCCCGSRAR